MTQGDGSLRRGLILDKTEAWMFGNNLKTIDWFDYIPEDYFQSRDRFLGFSSKNGLVYRGFSLGEEISGRENFENSGLTIDTVTIDSKSKSGSIKQVDNERTLLLTAGLHGVEGFFGAAVLQSVMENFAAVLPKGIRLVLVHCLNPYGFANCRRFDKNNVDLNRNFLLEGESFEGVAEQYDWLQNFLNPTGSASSTDWYWAKAFFYISRFGIPALKQAIAGGQYEYPAGIFYGGKEPAAIQKPLRELLGKLIGPSRSVLHLDFHTGLGKYADYCLLLTERELQSHRDFYESVFDAEKMDLLGAGTKNAYKIQGLFGEWLQRQFSSIPFRFAGVEFGTYHPVRVLRAIRNENRVHQFDKRQSQVHGKWKAELKECFCPSNPKWQKSALKKAFQVVERAIVSLAETEIG